MFKQTEFVVGRKYTVEEGVTLNKGDIIQILPVEFLDSDCDENIYRDFVREYKIQEDLAVIVQFFTKENYRMQFIDGTTDPKLELPVHVFNLPNMFRDLKVKSRVVRFRDDV